MRPERMRREEARPRCAMPMRVRRAMRLRLPPSSAAIRSAVRRTRALMPASPMFCANLRNAQRFARAMLKRGARVPRRPMSCSTYDVLLT